MDWTRASHHSPLVADSGVGIHKLNASNTELPCAQHCSLVLYEGISCLVKQWVLARIRAGLAKPVACSNLAIVHCKLRAGSTLCLCHPSHEFLHTAPLEKYCNPPSWDLPSPFLGNLGCWTKDSRDYGMLLLCSKLLGETEGPSVSWYHVCLSSCSGPVADAGNEHDHCIPRCSLTHCHFGSSR